MGTRSLVSGLILIIVGLGLGVLWIIRYPSSELPFDEKIMVGSLVILPFIVIGGLLLGKYYNDKKKEKNSSTQTSSLKFKFNPENFKSK